MMSLLSEAFLFLPNLVRTTTAPRPSFTHTQETGYTRTLRQYRTWASRQRHVPGNGFAPYRLRVVNDAFRFRTRRPKNRFRHRSSDPASPGCPPSSSPRSRAMLQTGGEGDFRAPGLYKKLRQHNAKSSKLRLVHYRRHHRFPQ